MPDPDDVLNTIIADCDVGKNITVRHYLVELLLTLWVEGEQFSGKRPFGNSGWEYDIYKALVSAGVVCGELDEYGDIVSLDREAACESVASAIRSLGEL